MRTAWDQDVITGAVDDSPNVQSHDFIVGNELVSTSTALMDMNKTILVKRILLAVALQVIGSGANIAYKVLITLIKRSVSGTFSFDPNYSSSADERADIMYQCSNMIVGGNQVATTLSQPWDIDINSVRKLGTDDKIMLNIGFWTIAGTAPAAGASMAYNIHYRALFAGV